MDHAPSEKDLRSAARACVILAYATGLAGIAGGTLALRDGSPTMAVILWIVTFAVGTGLTGTALLIRAFAGLLAQVTRLQADVQALSPARTTAGLGPPPDTGRDPWLRH